MWRKPLILQYLSERWDFCFRVLSCSAETLVRLGAKNSLFVTYGLSSIYESRLMYIKVIVRHISVVFFEKQCACMCLYSECVGAGVRCWDSSSAAAWQRCHDVTCLSSAGAAWSPTSHSHWSHTSSHSADTPLLVWLAGQQHYSVIVVVVLFCFLACLASEFAASEIKWQQITTVLVTWRTSKSMLAITA